MSLVFTTAHGTERDQPDREPAQRGRPNREQQRERDDDRREVVREHRLLEHEDHRDDARPYGEDARASRRRDSTTRVAPMIAATMPSSTAATRMPSRSPSNDVSFRNWNSFPYSGPLPVWYVIDCRHTRPRPHGTAGANHTATAAPDAAAMCRAPAPLAHPPADRDQCRADERLHRQRGAEQHPDEQRVAEAADRRGTRSRPTGRTR